MFTVNLCSPLHLFYTDTAPRSYSQITSIGVWGWDPAVWAPRIILMYLLGSVREAVLFWIVESLQDAVTADMSEGE